MQKMVLCSNIIDREGRDAFESFLGRKTNGMKTLFIPTGGNPEANLTWIKEDYSAIIESLELNIEVYDIEDLSPEEFQVLVRQFEMIWMSGGIASYLLNAVKKVKLDTLLSSLLNEGIVYVGSSSGAMIMNPTLKVAEWYIGEPDQKSKGIAGLGFTDFYVYPHYDENQKEAIIKLKDFSEPLYLQKENGAICLQDGKITGFIGAKPEIIY